MAWHGVTYLHVGLLLELRDVRHRLLVGPLQLQTLLIARCLDRLLRLLLSLQQLRDRVVHVSNSIPIHKAVGSP